MDQTLNRKGARDCRRFSLSTTSKVDPLGPINSETQYDVVMWADVPFVYAVGSSPSVVLPTESTLGDAVWPANVPIRISVMAGHRIAAAAVTGTGALTILPGV